MEKSRTIGDANFVEEANKGALPSYEVASEKVLDRMYDMPRFASENSKITELVCANVFRV